jgi:large subunit ribosomal protein L24
LGSFKIRKGDKVKVISGKDRGKSGKVLRALPREARIVVEGVNVAKRHTRPSQRNPQGGIIEKELPIHISNVMLICPRCNRSTRVSRQVTSEGAVRVCKKCEREID